ncbi:MULTISPECIES: hypothetical protein [Roseateles]|uniref:Uncharacterized protein n=1 Tax=Roseateles albus TaxID=2987525 RepID=A0ABT5KMT3_9BURK|nr:MULTISPECIES: hypothetical protein [Roseateles]MCV2361487.1 hypothetical protein [Paucibacter sp. TC2R-5]MDC8774225.1 hypothetical protein [Roseateles albus]
MRLTELRGPDASAAEYEWTHEAWRLRLAIALRCGSALLARLAHRLLPQRHKQRKPELEFYAEAGAPEGALYADGRRIGTLSGITRL